MDREELVQNHAFTKGEIADNLGGGLFPVKKLGSIYLELSRLTIYVSCGAIER